MTESRAQRARGYQDAGDAELAVVAPSVYMAIADDDPRRCPPAGVGKLHDIREDRDGVRRCSNCRRDEAALYPQLEAVAGGVLMADAPVRAHPIVNPEQCATLLWRVVSAWDQDDQETFMTAIAEARRLVGQRAAQNDLYAGEV